MRFIDTHVHLDDEQYDADRPGVLARAAEAGVVAMVAVGTTATSSAGTAALAKTYPSVFAAVGIQPNYAAAATDDHWSQIRELVTHDRIVAIGETGLDHFWDYAPLDVQRKWFARHVELSLESGLPLVIHMREGKHGTESDSCCVDILSVLRDTAGGARLLGVMHSYTGTRERAREFIELGFFISFAGMVTYKSAIDLRLVAAAVPQEHLLLETDGPYLSPHPFRGKAPNEPALLVHTAACLAEVRGQALEELAKSTTANAARLFRIPLND